MFRCAANRAFSKKRASAVAAAVLTLLFVFAFAVHDASRPVEVHRRGLQNALMQYQPNASKWTLPQKIKRSFRKQIPHDRLSAEIDQHRAKLIELGYFRVVEIKIPTSNAFESFRAAALTNNWQCDLWSFTGYTGTVRLTAFVGDIPAWLKLAGDSSRTTVEGPDL
jgi:hypothetical protein